ncbi:hypothetical protein PV327_001504 [Microctonus hyperodae]|uniref:sphingomyelin phosphodiesterase n=1 Tax=Microctonus hyperodae TaxID=165561 RepID=A0AA39G9L6_MICHY|nr:hypothetical protein PV327_001504 [Microctonus hyperodae]
MNREINLKVITLNCWGIPYVSKNRSQRMYAIAEELSSSDFDVVCLQEVWSTDDFTYIKKTCQENLPHSHYFHSGVLGSGLCLLSKYPIQDVMFHKWSLNGYVHKIHHGDWFGGKGVGLCKLKVYNMNINVYVAHLHAEYNCEHDEYSAHRVLQAFDMAQFIRMTEQGADAVVLGGDLNTGPGDLAYNIIKGVVCLNDSCSTVNNDLGTSECANNSYTSEKIARKFPQGKRIDHILYLGSKNIKMDVLSYRQPFPKRVPNMNFSFSDHEAVMAEFQLTEGEYSVVDVDPRGSLKDALNICRNSLQDIKRQRLWYLVASLLLILPLTFSIGLDPIIGSIAAVISLNIFRLFVTAILCYTLFMSSIWNSVECNALKAGLLEMEIHLQQLNNNGSKKQS